MDEREDVDEPRLARLYREHHRRVAGVVARIGIRTARQQIAQIRLVAALDDDVQRGLAGAGVARVDDRLAGLIERLDHLVAVALADRLEEFVALRLLLRGGGNRDGDEKQGRGGDTEGHGRLDGWCWWTCGARPNRSRLAAP